MTNKNGEWVCIDDPIHDPSGIGILGFAHCVKKEESIMNNENKKEKIILNESNINKLNVLWKQANDENENEEKRKAAKRFLKHIKCYIEPSNIKGENLNEWAMEKCMRKDAENFLRFLKIYNEIHPIVSEKDVLSKEYILNNEIKFSAYRIDFHDPSNIIKSHIKKIYIAGPISNDPDFFKKFELVQDELEGKGYIVMNPALLRPGFTQEEYLKVCFTMIDQCDTLYFLKGFIHSKGSMKEYIKASNDNKNILFQ